MSGKQLRKMIVTQKKSKNSILFLSCKFPKKNVKRLHTLLCTIWGEVYKITEEKQRVVTIIVFNVSKLKPVAGALLCYICYANHTSEKNF